MSKWVKRPVVVEAFQWFGDERQTEDPEWIVDALMRYAEWDGGNPVSGMTPPAGTARVDFSKDGKGMALFITTLEGVMTALPGDYIIRGVKGEIYPCKAEIFEETYHRLSGDGYGLEPVDEPVNKAVYEAGFRSSLIPETEGN